MASFIVGKYVYSRNENLIEFYKGMNVPEQLVDKLVPAEGAFKEFTVDGNKITMSGGKDSVTFVLDTEIDETNQHNYKLKSTAKLEGSSLIVTSKAVEDGKLLIRTYNTNEIGLMITMKSDTTDVEAKIFYKRA